MPERTSSSSRHVRAGSGNATGERARVRIIGGNWRGRWIHFFAAQGLRPTGDRMRETLFNWIQIPVRGARCLDLFAGTGVLGIEAISRGAAEAVLVERSPAVGRQLENEIANLVAGESELEHRLSVQSMAAQEFIETVAQTHAPFDIVFVDPPFSQDVQIDVLNGLLRSELLAPQAMIYVEAPADMTLKERIPVGLEIFRTSTQGKVQCLLLERSGE